MTVTTHTTESAAGQGDDPPSAALDQDYSDLVGKKLLPDEIYFAASRLTRWPRMPMERSICGLQG